MKGKEKKWNEESKSVICTLSFCCFPTPPSPSLPPTISNTKCWGKTHQERTPIGIGSILEYDIVLEKKENWGRSAILRVFVVTLFILLFVDKWTCVQVRMCCHIFFCFFLSSFNSCCHCGRSEVLNMVIPKHILLAMFTCSLIGLSCSVVNTKMSTTTTTTRRMNKIVYSGDFDLLYRVYVLFLVFAL